MRLLLMVMAGMLFALIGQSAFAMEMPDCAGHHRQLSVQPETVAATVVTRHKPGDETGLPDCCAAGASCRLASCLVNGIIPSTMAEPQPRAGSGFVETVTVVLHGLTIPPAIGPPRPIPC